MGNKSAINVKITTLSLRPEILEKLLKMSNWMHTPNKSILMSMLIEKEYRRMRSEREENGLPV